MPSLRVLSVGYSNPTQVAVDNADLAGATTAGREFLAGLSAQTGGIGPNSGRSRSGFRHLESHRVSRWQYDCALHRAGTGCRRFDVTLSLPEHARSACCPTTVTIPGDIPSSLPMSRQRTERRFGRGITLCQCRLRVTNCALLLTESRLAGRHVPPSLPRGSLSTVSPGWKLTRRGSITFQN